jgi:hypothetical protein
MNKMSSLSQEQQQSTVRGKEFFSRIWSNWLFNSIQNSVEVMET